MECKTIIKFLTINADTSKEKIDENDQDIQLFQIFINKNDKDINKYDYSHINFIIDISFFVNHYIVIKINYIF